MCDQKLGALLQQVERQLDRPLTVHAHVQSHLKNAWHVVDLYDRLPIEDLRSERILKQSLVGTARLLSKHPIGEMQKLRFLFQMFSEIHFTGSIVDQSPITPLGTWRCTHNKFWFSSADDVLQQIHTRCVSQIPTMYNVDWLMRSEVQELASFSEHAGSADYFNDITSPPETLPR